MSQITINGSETALEQVLLNVAGRARYLLKVTDLNGPQAEVLNEAGTIIGEAHRIYRDGWAVRTEFFAGYVPDRAVVLQKQPTEN